MKSIFNRRFKKGPSFVCKTSFIFILISDSQIITAIRKNQVYGSLTIQLFKSKTIKKYIFHE